MEEDQRVHAEVDAQALPEMAAKDPQSVPLGPHGLQSASPSNAFANAGHTERLSSDKVPVDQLAQMDYDKSVFFFGIVPLAAVCAVLLVYVALYFYRRGKQWNELGEAMRLEEEPGTASRQSGFSTAELANLDPTRPSEPLHKVDDGKL